MRDNAFTGFEGAPGSLGTTSNRSNVVDKLAEVVMSRKPTGKYEIAGKSQQRLEREVAFVCLLHHSEKVTERVDRSHLPHRVSWVL